MQLEHRECAHDDCLAEQPLEAFLGSTSNLTGGPIPGTSRLPVMSAEAKPSRSSSATVQAHGAGASAAFEGQQRLQFGSFDDSIPIVPNVPVAAGALAPALQQPGSSGCAGALARTLSPMSSAAVEAKPFSPHSDARPDAAAPASSHPEDSAIQVPAPAAAKLNVNAREFTPCFGSAAPGRAPPPTAQGRQEAEAPLGQQLPLFDRGASAAGVAWSDVGFVDGSEGSQEWPVNQWGYPEQVMWSEEYQQYGTYGPGIDGQYVWFPCQMEETWTGDGMQYWDGNVPGLNGGAVYYPPHGEDGVHDAYLGNGNGAYAPGTGGAKGPGSANGYSVGPRRAVPAFPPSMSYARQPRTKEKKRRDGRKPGGMGAPSEEALSAAAVGVLEQQFPAYSGAALREMLCGACSGDLSRALDLLTRLEAECVSARVPAPPPARSPAGKNAAGSVRAEKALVLDEANFPALTSPAKPGAASQPDQAHVVVVAKSGSAPQQPPSARPASPISPLPGGDAVGAAKFGIESGGGVPSASASAPDFSDTAGSVASTDERPPSAEDFSFRSAPAAASASSGTPVTGAASDANGFGAAAAVEKDTDACSQAPPAVDADGVHASADGANPVCDGAPDGMAATGEKGAAAGSEEGEVDGAQEKENCAQNGATWQPAAAPLVSAWAAREKLLFEPSPAEDCPPGLPQPAGLLQHKPRAEAAISGAASVLVARRPPSARRSSGYSGSGGYSSGGGAAAEQVPWVATGAAADAQYRDARSDARDHCRLRNTFFQQATQAYLAGDKALAKELGAKGRYHAHAMTDAHSAASAQIYRARNPSRGAEGGGCAVIDLHGQHVGEALKHLRREVARLRGAALHKGDRSAAAPSPAAGGVPAAGAGGGRAQRPVRILVGTTAHSKVKHTPMRLPAAVEDFLRSEGIAFKTPLPGALEIMA